LGTSQTKFSRKDLVKQIMAYLVEHPKAQDTLEGILHWWLLEQHIKNLMVEVKEALAELVAQGLLLERRGSDGRIHYRINRRKETHIRALLEKGRT
jgi:hypothetical protein